MSSFAHSQATHSDLAWDFRFTRTLWIASYALLIYDYILTLSDEIAYMWGGNWTRAKALFLLTRYWTIASLLPPVVAILLDHPEVRTCSFSYGWFVYTELITQTFGSIILILRVYAIYESNKPLLKALVALLVSVLLVQIIFSAILSDTTGMKLNQTLRTSGCIPNNWVYKPWVYWVPATTFDGLLFSLVVFKSIQYAWEQHTSALLFTMLRDSFLYFGSVFLIIVADLIVWTRSSEGLYVALPQMVPVLHSIMACRMLLNISQCTRPWLAEPWRDQDAAVFSAALRLMSLFKSPTGPIIPTVQLPESPVTEETCI